MTLAKARRLRSVTRRQLVAAALGVLIGTAMGCKPPAPEALIPQYGQLPLPTKLGISIQEVKDAETAAGLQDEALDEEDRLVARGPEWRWRFQILLPERPGLGVNVVHRYRAQDGIVWLIFVTNAAGRYGGELGPVGFNTRIADVEASLGSPALRYAVSTGRDKYVWHRGDTHIVVEAYSRADEDITGLKREGEIASVLAYSTTLGPPGFLGYDVPSKR